MSSFIIGKNAVAAVDRKAMVSGKLLTEIPVGDTYPSWDGEILVYNSSEARNQRRKSDIAGRVPVQVKGKYVEEFSEDERAFDIEVADLINYANDAGALFFVVEMIDITDVYKTKIFYAELLTYDIQEMLKGKEEQITISCNFQELQQNRFYSLCKHFLFHRNEQGFKIIKWDKDYEYDEYVFTIIGNKESDLDFYLFDAGTYIYGKDKETNLKIPLSKFKADTKVEQDEFDIGINDKVYYNKIYREKTRTGKRTMFGKSFTIEFSDSDLVNINFKESGSISERIKDCEFFLEIIKTGEVQFNYTEVKLNFDKDKNQEILEFLPKHILELKDFLKTFNYLGVYPNEDFKKFLKHINQLMYLRNIILKRNLDKVKITDNQFQEIHIGTYKFLLAKSTINNTKELFNFFDYEELTRKFKIVVSQDETLENPVRHSPYVLLEPDHLYCFDNLNLESIEQSLINQDYSNSMTIEVSNKFLLDTLAYCDLNQNNKNNDILFMVYNVYNHIYQQTDEVIFFINKFQALYRKRKFNDEEITEIIEVKDKINENVILCVIDLLLDNIKEFEYRYERLIEEDKKLISEYPIYNLIHNKL